MSSHYTKKAQKQRKEVKTEQEIIKDLRTKIRLIEALPSDFRDIALGSNTWKFYRREFPKRLSEMEKWRLGHTLVYEELTDKERQILNYGRADRVLDVDPHKILNEVSHYTWTEDDIKIPSWTFISCLLWHAISSNCSWVYFKSFTLVQVEALNILLSRVGAPVRAKPRLEGKGHTTPGDVY